MHKAEPPFSFGSYNYNPKVCKKQQTQALMIFKTSTII